jgi:hypothetical protein
MSRSLVQTAAKLLAKAESTTSDHEAIALVERSYSLLAKAITEYDRDHPDGEGGVRRRERRRLTERRRRSRSDNGNRSNSSNQSGPPDPGRTGDPIARYRGAAGDGGYAWRRGIDVNL